MRPTALGVKAGLFYLLLLAAFFAAPYANHFFLLLAFLTILGLLSLLWALTNALRVRGHVAAIAPGPAGTRLPVTVTVDGGRAVFAELDLEGEGRVVVRDRLPALARGVYRVRSANLASVWPLGLLRIARRAAAPEEVVVYPVPAAFDAEGGAGDDGVAQNDTMLQPAGLREYRHGDDARRVHWKASARRDALVIMEWDGGLGHGPEIVFDRRCEPAVLERALSRLVGLALLAREEETPLTLHTQGLSAVFGDGQHPWVELLRFLAGAEALPPAAPAPPPAPPSARRLP